VAVSIPAPFSPQGEHFAIDLPGARALFTTRRGGVSSGPYASLNLGISTDDDPAAVRANRERVAEAIGRPLAGLRQVHGASVVRTGAPRGGAPPEADGQLATQPGVAPMVLVADCLPIVVALPGAVTVLHAGWRGLAGGIVSTGLAALTAAAGWPAGEAVAAIGPGAGGCCYEVGEEVHAAFAAHAPGVHRGRNLDLKAIARAELQAAGVGAVHDIGLCTLCAPPGLLFSHRRAGGVTGRQAGIAWLAP
jgi:YfiH family protein